MVDISNEENFNRATNNLRSVFSNDFAFENPKKNFLPKLLTTNILILVIEGVAILKNVTLKCSPKIRNCIMNTNGGFAYLNLVRCKL